MNSIKKHSTLVIVLGIVTVIGAAMVYVLLQPQQVQTPSSDMSQTETSQSSQETPPTITGSYIDYSETTLQATEGRRILFFYAPWCPQCQALDADIRASAVPEGATIFKTDYDTNQALRQKYGVTIQTTLVEIDENGNEIKKYVAYDEPSLTAVVAAFGL